jgi:ATP-binding cassette subfamily B protein
VKSLLYLNKYFYKYRFRLGLGVLFVAISNFFGIVPAQLIRLALDQSADLISYYEELSWFSYSSEFRKLISVNLLVFVGLVLLMALLKGFFMFLMRQTIIIVSRFIEYDLKNEVYEHYQDLDYTFYSTARTGDLMNRISEDVSRVRMYVGPALMYTVNLIVMFILVLTAMLRVNPELTLYTLLPLPVLSFVIYFVQEIINKKSERVQAKLSDLSTHVQESLSGIRVIKSFIRESKNIEDFTRLSGEYRGRSLDLVRVNALFIPSLLLLIGLSTIFTIYIGGRFVIDGTLTIGNIAEFIIYINMLMWPVAALGWVVSLVQRAAASQERINEFLHIRPRIVSGAKFPENFKGEIEFRDVSYTYPHSGIRAVKNVSFSINPGESLAITGKTGSGKSTLAALLLRQIDPSDGQILVDGIDLREIDLRKYRSHLGYVPQDVFLFSDTIRNNISFGLAGEKSERELETLVQEAANKAVIHENIMEFPEAYSTRVGERGITLSGGQKQRISIARALVRDPNVLVFDDCLSAVDTRTESRILDNLHSYIRERSVIMIGNRISSVKSISRIIVLDDGAITEQGDHDELLALGGRYAEIYEMQLSDQDDGSNLTI